MQLNFFIAVITFILLFFIKSSLQKLKKTDSSLVESKSLLNCECEEYNLCEYSEPTDSEILQFIISDSVEISNLAQIAIDAGFSLNNAFPKKRKELKMEWELQNLKKNVGRLIDQLADIKSEMGIKPKNVCFLENPFLSTKIQQKETQFFSSTVINNNQESESIKISTSSVPMTKSKFPQDSTSFANLFPSTPVIMNCSQKVDDMYSSPEGCDSYITCWKGVLSSYKCENTLLFDPIKRLCSANPEVKKNCGIDCFNKANDVYSHPRDCEKYIDCVAHQPTIVSCPPNFLFDFKSKSCKVKEFVKCK